MTTTYTSPRDSAMTLPHVTVRVCTPLDEAAASWLSVRLDEALSLSPRHLVVDLADCPYVDSSGLTAMLDAHRAALAQGTTLVLRRPSARTLRAVELSGLQTVFTVDHGGAP